MNNANLQSAPVLVVEDEVHLSLVELCHACGASEEYLIAWVYEGVLEADTAEGDMPSLWRFKGDSLRRAKQAARLTDDLDLNPPGVALALDLLDQIDDLKANLRRQGG